MATLREHVARDRQDRPARRDYLTPDLPKTRSGKIMRRLLRDVAEGRRPGDTTTLADPRWSTRFVAGRPRHRPRSEVTAEIAAARHHSRSLSIEVVDVGPDRATLLAMALGRRC